MPGKASPVMSLREESHDENNASPFHPSDSRSGGKNELYISEYPGLLFGGKSDATNVVMDDVKEAITSTSELDLIDYFSLQLQSTDSKAGVTVYNPSHRHWSGMHWLFPSSFLPFGSLMHSESSTDLLPNAIAANVLYKAAEATMREKSRAGGGHTGWSAVWGACLWARAGRSEEAWAYVTRILHKYTAPNLLGLHPSLTHFSTETCETCYIDSTLDRGQIARDFAADPEVRDSLGTSRTASFHSEYYAFKERRNLGSLARDSSPDSLISPMWGALGFGKGKVLKGFDARYVSFRGDRGLETADGAKVRRFYIFIYICCCY